MRKMCGGGDTLNPGINQTIDFIIKCQDKILVRKNPDVTGNLNEVALIGTFSSASLYNKVPNRLATEINSGIGTANTAINASKTINEVKSMLVDLTKPENEDVVKGLLIKKLLQPNHSSKNTTTNNNKKAMESSATKLIPLLENVKITPVNNDFHELIGDTRLTQGECAKPNNKCIVLTQLFKLDINMDIYNALLKDKFELKTFLKDSWFIGHKNLLNKVM